MEGHEGACIRAVACSSEARQEVLSARSRPYESLQPDSPSGDTAVRAYRVACKRTPCRRWQAERQPHIILTVAARNMPAVHGPFWPQQLTLRSRWRTRSSLAMMKVYIGSKVSAPSLRPQSSRAISHWLRALYAVALAKPLPRHLFKISATALPASADNSWRFAADPCPGGCLGMPKAFDLHAASAHGKHRGGGTV